MKQLIIFIGLALLVMMPVKSPAPSSANYPPTISQLPAAVITNSSPTLLNGMHATMTSSNENFNTFVISAGSPLSFVIAAVNGWQDTFQFQATCVTNKYIITNCPIAAANDTYTLEWYTNDTTFSQNIYYEYTNSTGTWALFLANQFSTLPNGNFFALDNLNLCTNQGIPNAANASKWSVVFTGHNGAEGPGHGDLQVLWYTNSAVDEATTIYATNMAIWPPNNGVINFMFLGTQYIMFTTNGIGLGSPIYDATGNNLLGGLASITGDSNTNVVFSGIFNGNYGTRTNTFAPSSPTAGQANWFIGGPGGTNFYWYGKTSAGINYTNKASVGSTTYP